MSVVIGFPKMHADFSAIPTMRSMVAAGWPPRIAFEINRDWFNRAATKEVSPERVGEILVEVYMERLARMTDEEKAELEERAAEFANIRTERLSDDDWRNLMRWD